MAVRRESVAGAMHTFVALYVADNGHGPICSIDVNEYCVNAGCSVTESDTYHTNADNRNSRNTQCNNQ